MKYKYLMIWLGVLGLQTYLPYLQHDRGSLFLLNPPHYIEMPESIRGSRYTVITHILPEIN